MPITVWLLDVRDVTDAALAEAERWLSSESRARLTPATHARRRQQFVLGRALLRVAVSRECGCDPSTIGIMERPDDAPALALEAGGEPHFSLSHSGAWIACATSLSRPVGVDIETIDASRDLVALSEAAFSPDEHAWLLAQRDRLTAFYRLWTATEAQLKLRTRAGSGIAAYVHHENPADGLALAVAFAASADRPRVERVRGAEITSLGPVRAATATSYTSSPAPSARRS